ncbi:methyl-accepting chemotaxis protein [Cohnella silvisoli]|uniref:HAMP domain-containing methyl-accepting chemotaxis protein n=1 Tax=Cohnella silvisoli TaxID=2873699 RepID=A0ABV1KQS5_9BACL|nr:HAMP domain-containing methyl-accepting chemotaxis protein [Cohnella silvisoli]MCD9022194.1 HAMP domain-containing protein [Cohnella silvisoli]
MQMILKPALFILNSLKYGYKFLLIGILILIPLAVTMYYLVVELNRGYEFAYDERTGVEYNLGLQAMMSAVDEHRRLAVSGGDQAQTAEALVDRKIAEMDITDRNLGAALEASKDWEKLKQHWTMIKTSGAAMSAKQSSQEHALLLEEGAALISHVGDTSKLILDPDLDSYYLMDATVIRLPLLAKQIGDLRDQGKQLAEKKTLTREQLTDLTEQATEIRIAVNAIGTGYKIIIEQNPPLKAKLEQTLQQFQTSAEQFLAALKEGYLTNDTVTGTYDQYTEASQAAIKATNALYVVDAKQLDGLIQTREIHYSQVKRFVISFVVILISIVCYMFIGFYASIMRAIRLLLHSTTEVSKGRLQTRMPIATRDEMKSAAQSFNHMVSEMRELIGASSRNAEQAANTSARLADIAKHSSESNALLSASIQETASGTNMQLQSTMDSAKAISEMAIGIGRIAETTGSALQVSLESAGQAEEGKLALDRVVNQMGAIQQSVNGTAQSIGLLNGFAQQVGQMAEFIKGIAYKSNILALNASIEAVRAGEHGRGFIVVASETRKLAELSGSSADGIADLLSQIQSAGEQSYQAMNDVQQEVQLGSRAVQDAGLTFQLILSSTRSIASQIQEISAASEQMSASSEQVSATIQQIADIAKGSSEQADQMNDVSSRNLTAMKELSEQAEMLKNLSYSLQRQIEKFTS